jgi:hypothetical protein
LAASASFKNPRGSQNPRGGCAPSSFSKDDEACCWMVDNDDVDEKIVCETGTKAAAEAMKEAAAARIMVFMIVVVVVEEDPHSQTYV